MSKYFFLFLPIVFSAAAQLFIKSAALKDVKSTGWYISFIWSIVMYLLAFLFYSVAVRYFPISVASSVNTIAVMLVVVFGGIFIWGEAFGMRQVIGLSLGSLALLFLLSSDG